MYKMYPPVKEVLEKWLLDIPLVSEDLSIELPGEDRPYLFIPVIDVYSSKTDCYDFATVIAHQMKLESVAPSHRPLSISSHSLENLVGIAAQVVTHGEHRGVHETDATAPGKALKLHKEHQVEEHAGHEFHKSVI